MPADARHPSPKSKTVVHPAVNKRRQPRPQPARSISLGAVRARLSRLSLATLAIGAAILAGAAILIGATVAVLNDRDWAVVARVGNQEINRAAVRGREEVLQFVLSQQVEAIDTARQAGLMEEQEAATLASALEQQLAEVRSLAIEDLVNATLARSWMTENGLAVGATDIGQELQRARQSLVDRRLRWIRIAWQPGPPNGTQSDVSQPGQAPDEELMVATATELRAALSEGVRPDELAPQYEAAGWSVVSGERWLPAAGHVAWLDSEAVAAARLADTGPLPPIVGVGWAVVADLVTLAPDGPSGAAVLDTARLQSVSGAALADWARDRAQARAVEEVLVMAWPETSMEMVRAAEVVIGPSDPQGPSGPWVQLAHLVTADVPVSVVAPGEGSTGDRLAATLRSLGPSERRARFWEFVAEARATNPRSGELGFFVREQLAPGLAERAFAEDVRSADVLGPIVTDFGEELFLIQAQYSGPLDDRSIGALTELRRGTASLFEMASALAPGEAARALGGPWRVAAEFATQSPAYRALFETLIGELSDPFALDGQLLVAQVLERRNSLPAHDALARLRVSGFAAWLADRRSEAAITYVEDIDLPGQSPAASGVPTQLPQASPRLPVTPPVP
jgi:hypothetical protein